MLIFAKPFGTRYAATTSPFPFPSEHSSPIRRRVASISSRPRRPSGVLGRWMCASRCRVRSEEHTSELQSHHDLVCRLLLEKKKKKTITTHITKKNKIYKKKK